MHARFVTMALSVMVVAGVLCVESALAQTRKAPAQKPPGKKTPEQSPQQKRAMARLLAEFRRTRSKSRKAAIVKRLFALGEPGARAMLDEINARMADVMTRYEEAFAKRAAIVTKAQRKKLNVAEVQKLRAQVLALKQRPELTKQMIVREADPALKRLNAILGFDRLAVLKGAPKSMIDLRKRLQGLGKYHEQCVQQLTGGQPRPMPKRRPRRRPRTKKPRGFEDFLRDRERIVAQVAGSGNVAMVKILAANSKLAARLGPEEARNILHCNLTRHLLGLRVLAIDLKLAAAARDHSRDMERLNFFSHTSPIAEKRSFTDRAARFGTRASGENIFRGRTDGLFAHDGWFHSPGHHRNMLAPHARIGVGRSGVCFTQLFGR